MSSTKLEKFKQDLIFEEKLRGHTLRFHTTWGLFNPTEIDQGSRLLLDHIEIRSDAVSLDLGCGYGPIGLTLAMLAPTGEVHLVDKDFVAVEYARKNARLNHLDHCQVYLSNAFSHVPDIRFDLIASNLPARVGSELLYIILEDARSHLKPGGRLYLVTISRLKECIRRNFQEIFGNYHKVKQGATHTVAMAIR